MSVKKSKLAKRAEETKQQKADRRKSDDVGFRSIKGVNAWYLQAISSSSIYLFSNHLGKPTVCVPYYYYPLVAVVLLEKL